MMAEIIEIQTLSPAETVEISVAPIPALSGLADTTISNPQSNDVLVWNSVLDRWVNSVNIAQGAAQAEKLSTARQIALTGDVSGSVLFDGSSDVSIAVAVADDSHNHVINNIDGLQAELDSKAPLASPALTGTPTAPTADGSNLNQVVNVAALLAELEELKSQLYAWGD